MARVAGRRRTTGRRSRWTSTVPCLDPGLEGRDVIGKNSHLLAVSEGLVEVPPHVLQADKVGVEERHMVPSGLEVRSRETRDCRAKPSWGEVDIRLRLKLGRRLSWGPSRRPGSLPMGSRRRSHPSSLPRLLRVAGLGLGGEDGDPTDVGLDAHGEEGGEGGELEA